MDRQTRIRLQQHFDLCADPDAVALPLALNEKIWANRPIESLVDSVHLELQHTEAELTRTARKIVTMMPCWLVYGETKRIVSDVRDLLTTREELFSAT